MIGRGAGLGAGGAVVKPSPLRGNGGEHSEYAGPSYVARMGILVSLTLQTSMFVLVR